MSDEDFNPDEFTTGVKSKEELADVVWSHLEKPTELIKTDELSAQHVVAGMHPDEVETHEKTFVNVVSEDGAARRIDNYWTAIHDHDRAMIILSSSWWGSEKFGEWETLWFGELQTVTENGGVCIKNIPHPGRITEPFDVANSYRYGTEDYWLPASAIDVLIVDDSPEADDSYIVSDDGIERGKLSDADVVFDRYAATQYGSKLVLEFAPPWEGGEPIKDAVKELDWDSTHRVFDKDVGAWTVDGSATVATARHLIESGFTVGFDTRMADRFENSRHVDGDLEVFIG